MYVKCGSIEDASQVFNKIPSHNVVAWNMMLFGHVKCGEREKALEPFQQMQQEGVQPDPVTFVGVMNACGVAALEEGRLQSCADGMVPKNMVHEQLDQCQVFG
ncbi:unnamed protein product [Sphagnum compactum]